MFHFKRGVILTCILCVQRLWFSFYMVDHRPYRVYEDFLHLSKTCHFCKYNQLFEDFSNSWQFLKMVQIKGKFFNSSEYFRIFHVFSPFVFFVTLFTFLTWWKKEKILNYYMILKIFHRKSPFCCMHAIS